jgi:hypothetical protein
MSGLPTTHQLSAFQRVQLYLAGLVVRMKTPFHSFRMLLPLVMTGVQLGLLTASLIIHREPWVLPVQAESHAQSQSECSGENCISFSPSPPEPRTGRLVNAAILLNLPAVFLGAFLSIVAGLLHFPTSESSLLAFSAIFVPVIWFRIGKWVDVEAGKSSTPKVKSAWTIVARVIVWCLFALMLWSFLVERLREPETTKFLTATAILWTGAYLAVGLWGDRRKSLLRRAAVV